MSFLNIHNPKKRDEIVVEFLKTRKNIQQDNLNRKTGDLDYARKTEKLFKPVIETQKEMNKELKSIQQTFTAIPQQQPQLNIEGPSKEQLKTYGNTAVEYLSRFAEKENTDKTYGLYFESGQPKIGSAKVDIKDNDLIIDGNKYEGTPGLWELLVSKNPDPDKFTEQDLDNYKVILVNSNTMHQNNDPTSTKPKSGKSDKWKKIVSPVWKEYKSARSEGESAVETVYLSDNPNTLMERLALLRGEFEAGNKGVTNEAIEIIEELKKKNIIEADEYKKLNNIFQGLEM